MVYFIVSHKLDGSVREHSSKRGRVSLKESARTGISVDVARCAKDARPSSGIGLEVRIRRLEQYLDAVERCYGRLGLRRAERTRAALVTKVKKYTVLKMPTAQPAIPPASPERRTESRLPSRDGIRRREQWRRRRRVDDECGEVRRRAEGRGVEEP
jgi:hypothetical protein